MTTQAISYPARTHRSAALLAVSATTYLVLGVAFGIHAAFTLVVLAAVVALWVALCRRFPVVGALTLAFVSGFLGGLFGYGGYGRGYRR